MSVAVASFVLASVALGWAVRLEHSQSCQPEYLARVATLPYVGQSTALTLVGLISLASVVSIPWWTYVVVPTFQLAIGVVAIEVISRVGRKRGTGEQ